MVSQSSLLSSTPAPREQKVSLHLFSQIFQYLSSFTLSKIQILWAESGMKQYIHSDGAPVQTGNLSYTINTKTFGTPSQDGSVGRHGLPICITTSQPHQNYNENKEQPSLRNVRNWAEWKSDSCRKTPSIQTDRRCRNVEWAGPISMCGG